MPIRDHRTWSALQPAFASFLLGGAALAIGLVGFLYPMRGMRVVDIPLTGLLWFLVACITLASRRQREQALAGLLLAAAGFAVSLCVFMFDPLHPWRA